MCATFLRLDKNFLIWMELYRMALKVIPQEDRILCEPQFSFFLISIVFFFLRFLIKYIKRKLE